MTGRGALVTGAARGIGRAVAVRLAARGDTVLLADRDADEARRAARRITDSGMRARAVALDVTDVYRVREVIAEIDERTPLGTVVNNAGIARSSPLAEVTRALYDELMAVNVRACFFVLQAAARVMIPRRSGSIVNVASTSAFTASTTPMTVYDTSKGAVRMLTVAAARELAAYGVRVNAVAPGTVETDLTRALFSGGADALDAQAREVIPLGRLGEPSEIAAAVDFLSSRDAAYVTGHVLVVDGGWLT